ncbi:COQ9 family protein [Caulobacter sp. SLTY]|uniref:COQ9 family protein n=1 Tax=Caulobacter sp. SLTY TaxID=2683262 RepID=UPI001412997A|nr:COQ9 family protein [Caulobacter sp. SLTY]NBB14034.1 COQ9 family protein [Caulobacter sp. SLTY]
MTDWAETTEQAVLDEALALSAHMGWTRPMTLAAARKAGLTPGEADLLLPHGARDLAALLSRRHDAAALAALPDPASLKIRQRIRAAVEARLEAASADREALRRWAGFLSLPLNLPLALRLVWESADKLWRWAGDTATDENHYSKRAILSGILVSTTAIDLASGREAALAHLDARIQNVMDFEKWKAGIKPADFPREIAGALAAIRYGRA